MTGRESNMPEENMPQKDRSGGGRGADLFIIDNSDEQWKALRYLRDWCEISSAIDIATGYFEIGALLGLDGHWQKLEKIRILMGDEVSKRTHDAFAQAVGKLKSVLDASIEQAKETNDFLEGTPAIVEALQSGKISCRVYRERKFHAKAYITYPRMDVIGATALVGSSNFTYPGLTDNVELNVRIRNDVEELQAWYETYWEQAEEVTPEILKVIQRHTREFSPFEAYVKALYELFQGREMSASEWEKSQSVMYKILDHYQKEGYYDLLEKANTFGGALLCDSVGLGKTFIGLMLIERLLHDRKRVALFVPKAARGPVWEAKLNKYLPGVVDSRFGNNFVIYNHTDILRGGEYPQRMAEVAEKADVVIIDEAHHFRNQAARSYRKLFEMLEGKQLYLLTATPINNSSLDLQHLIELFSRRKQDHFRNIGIHSLPGHFRALEKALQRAAGDGSVDISAAEAEQVLKRDELYRSVVVQRSRAYARKSQEQYGGAKVVFPQREPPQVAPYSLQETYGNLLAELKRAFNKKNPLLSLAVYYPLNYPAQMTLEGKQGVEFEFEKGRQEQVVGLIRTQLLKRFESSAYAFRATCEGLLFKLLAWAEVHSETAAEKRRLARWKAQHETLLAEINRHRSEGEEELEDDSSLPVELLENVEKLSRQEFRVEEILDETFLDLDQLVVFLHQMSGFSPEKDDKIQRLISLLERDELMSRHKVLIFSEYKDTARYVYKTLKDKGFQNIAQVDSGRHADRGETIAAFSPYYNDSSSGELAARGIEETRILISTDVLSEGLNLQDATLMVNYDLHWNPVRLMQRIGRVDRRLDPDVEAKMLRDHPEWKELRGKIRFWNFLPPNELDDLLHLYERVAHKTLRISKIFGIEGRQLLKPDDDYEALKEFGKAYEGQTSPIEMMRLRLQEILKENPRMEDELRAMPLRVFSGRESERAAKAVFLCYAVPGADAEGIWSLEAGATRWYLYDLEKGTIEEEPETIHPLIESKPETPRRLALPKETLTEIRKKTEEHIKNSLLRRLQAPAGQKPVLKVWMELN
jgi:superfamily II DNA or RNA helicase